MHTPERDGSLPPAGSLPLRGAREALVARRRAQRGQWTFGDEADHAFLAAVRALAADDVAALHEARASGAELGLNVFSRRFAEDNVPGAIAILSASLLESGWGALRLEETFHRSARIAYDPSPETASAPPAARNALVEGVLEGFLSAAFNCQARARTHADSRFDVELLEGRDVNRAYGRRPL